MNCASLLAVYSVTFFFRQPENGGYDQGLSLPYSRLHFVSPELTIFMFAIDVTHMIKSINTLQVSWILGYSKFSLGLVT